MTKYKYFPLIKTRDSELRCFKHITTNQWKDILPIYELTKSRKTKIAPDGDISRRMEEIKCIQNEHPFILDLTTDKRYSNSQIEDLFNEQEGFLEWQYFLFDIYANMNIIPMIHVYSEDDEFSEVKKFVSNASIRTKTHLLALRLPYDIIPDDLSCLLEAISISLRNNCKLIIILDVGFFRNDLDSIAGTIIETCHRIEQFKKYIEEIVLTSTTFPLSPATEGKNDSCGSFTIFEGDLYNKVHLEIPTIKYGDYVSINTEQIEMRAITFVPRIDIVSKNCDQFNYKRIRRAEGGYIECAKKTLADCSHYENLHTWADDQIKSAAEGNPTGISPSFWISVRMNYYIEQRLKLLKRMDDFI